MWDEQSHHHLLLLLPTCLQCVWQLSSSVFQLIPQISSLSWFTTIVPLALVLSITAVKDATDDYVSTVPLATSQLSRVWVPRMLHPRSRWHAVGSLPQKGHCEFFSPAVSPQKRQPSKQSSISGPHPRLVSHFDQQPLKQPSVNWIISEWRIASAFVLISFSFTFSDCRKRSGWMFEWAISSSWKTTSL